MKKKAIIILTAIVLMVSCEPITQQQINADMATHITEFNYKGHKYLLYKCRYSNKDYGGITHNPDCPCHNKKEKYE